MPRSPGSISFDGASQYITAHVIGSGTCVLNGTFTIELWFKCGAQPNPFPLLLGKNDTWESNNQLYVDISLRMLV